MTDAMNLKPNRGIGPETVYAIDGMSCASCVARIEGALGTVPGVTSATVNLATARAHVHGMHVDEKAVIAAVSGAGYAAHAIQPEQPDDGGALMAAHNRRALRHVIIAALLSAPLAAGMVGDLIGLPLMLPAWAQLVLAGLVQFWLGARFYVGAFKAVWARAGNMDLLVALGTSAAYGLSIYQMLAPHHGAPHLYFEASAVLITFVLLGKWLEDRAKGQTAGALRALMNLRPETARVRRDGKIVELAAKDVVLGDICLVRPGDRIPVDGTVLKGESAVDESMLTGESLPIERGPGAPVKAGAINLDGLIEVETTAIGGETMLSQIIKLVESAQASKAGIQRLVDRVSAIFVPVVLLIALLTFLGWYFVSADVETALLAAVAVLVIACPCALGLATPTAIMVGTGVAARQGILIRDARTLEHARTITAVAFDKTGTLTMGKPEIKALGAAPGVAADRLLPLAAALQQHSSHPLAQAVLDKLEADFPHATLADAADFENHPGRGVSATVDGKALALGNRTLMAEHKVDIGALRASAALLEAEGDTISWLAEVGAEPKLLGMIAFGDTLKPEARKTVDALHAMGIRTIMITGDSEGAARGVADSLGIDRHIAGVLPGDKAAMVAELQAEGERVAMVGDGINDAPALAAADIGIAMATGTDIAMQAAGITLMRGDIGLVVAALDIARRTYGKIRQGLFWAFIYNIVGIPLAASGFLSPVLAGAAMAFSSVSVVLNALSLRRRKAFGSR